MWELGGGEGGVFTRSTMAEVPGDGGGFSPVVPELGGGRPEPTPPLSVSASFKEGRSSFRRRASMRPSFDADNDFITMLHGSDPVKVELNRLENEVRGANAARSGRFSC